MPREGERKEDLVSKLIYYITDTLSDTYEINFQFASREREWRLIEQQSNVCVYNKSKTSERQAIALFSNLPMILYPPNRLVLRAPLELSEPVSLETLTQQGLLVGIVKGRHYSTEIDQLIAANHQGLYLGAGNNKAERLHRMLSQGKLDGIVEYSSVFNSRKRAFGDKSNYYIYQLAEAQEPTKGYLACSRSSVGEKFIADFEQRMMTSHYQEFAISKFKEVDGLIESQFIIEQLGYK